MAVRGDLVRQSEGFDPRLKFDDIELIRRLSESRRFGVVEEKVFVSDRHYKEHGVARAILQYSLMALFFAIGKFEWANLPYRLRVREPRALARRRPATSFEPISPDVFVTHANVTGAGRTRRTNASQKQLRRKAERREQQGYR
jgi:hypothetical protein